MAHVPPYIYIRTASLASERSERDTLRCNAIEISLYLFIYLLASEGNERDTIRGVQIRAGAVYIYIYIYTLLMCSYSTEMASELA